MTGTLRLQDDGWKLESKDGEVVDRGDYPLKENDAFILSAADALDSWQYHNRPYDRIDGRSPAENDQQ